MIDQTHFLPVTHSLVVVVIILKVTLVPFAEDVLPSFLPLFLFVFLKVPEYGLHRASFIRVLVCSQSH